MTRLVAATLAAVLAVGPALAQVPYTARPVTLASSFDLDGEGVDADQVVTVATFADSTTFTIAAQPDVCRLIDATVVDANASISAGTLTVVGTDCWDQVLTVTFAAAGGSGVRTGTVIANDDPVRASGAYFKTIVSVISGALTGEGGAGDTLTVGVAAQAKSWPMYGRATRTPSGKRWVDVLGKYDVNCLVTNGAATTDVAGVTTASTACFENVNVGDQLIFNIGGEIIVRKVATRANADTITVNTGVTIAAAGVNFSYRKLYYFADPQDGWFPVRGYDAVSIAIFIDSNTDTGGVVATTECASFDADGLGAPDHLVLLNTFTTPTGAAGNATVTLDLRTLAHYTHCRVGFNFGTTDDDDTGIEDIDVFLGFRQ